jgi:ATP-dependent RNA helicase DDX19/DBP5
VGRGYDGQMTITRSIVFTLVVPRGTKLKENIIIGTPGKVVDWGVKYRFFDLGKISVFVLDEADIMIAMQGHQDQSFRIHK